MVERLKIQRVRHHNCARFEYITSYGDRHVVEEGFPFSSCLIFFLSRVVLLSPKQRLLIIFLFFPLRFNTLGALDHKWSDELLTFYEPRLIKLELWELQRNSRRNYSIAMLFCRHNYCRLIPLRNWDKRFLDFNETNQGNWIACYKTLYSLLFVVLYSCFVLIW